MPCAFVLPEPESRFFGRRVVRSAFLLAVFGWGVGFYGPPIYLTQVITRTGWSLRLVSVAVTVHFLFGALVVANLPRAHARLGLPVTTTLGAGLAAVGVTGWAVAAQPWQLFVAALASGAGWVAMGAFAVNAIVSRWYVAGRPSALGKAYNGASIGGAVFAPLWVALIQWMGFVGAAQAVGLVMFAVVACLSFAVFAKTPQSLGQLPDGVAALPSLAAAQQEHGGSSVLPREALWRDRTFLTLAAGMAIGLFAQVGLLAYLFDLLAPAMGAQTAGFLMGGGTACGIAGRMIAARALTYMADRRIVAAASYGMQAVGSLVLLASQRGQPWLIVPGIVLFGAGIGNATSLPPLIAQTDFAAREVPRVVASIVAVGQGAYAFAPAAFGLMLAAGAGVSTARPQADWLFIAAGAIQFAAAAIFLVGRRK
ncbi:MFS transporter [Bordetella sp. FB-8]|uniref:MFS transporter n=1 Tax=Bordetella sp. FB-8 TaxID=1159870 RepID=UPI0003A65F1D|nr:MFS transporter [Bordetella sp. FB-8]